MPGIMIPTDIRSFQKIGLTELAELCSYSKVELHRFLNHTGYPAGKFKVYENRLVGICLCQGAAQHYVDMSNEDKFDNEMYIDERKVKEKGYMVLPGGRVISGIKDIDVFFFFVAHDHVWIPNMRHCRKSVIAKFSNIGEYRIDFMKKGISKEIADEMKGVTPINVILQYLKYTHHGQAYLLKQSVIGLYPDEIFGKIIWKSKHSLKASNLKDRDTSHFLR
jgi:hypothetical protein